MFTLYLGVSKPFEAPQRSVGIEIKLNFSCSSGIRTGRLESEKKIKQKKQFCRWLRMMMMMMMMMMLMLTWLHMKSVT